MSRLLPRSGMNGPSSLAPVVAIITVEEVLEDLGGGFPPADICKAVAFLLIFNLYYWEAPYNDVDDV